MLIKAINKIYIIFIQRYLYFKNEKNENSMDHITAYAKN